MRPVLFMSTWFVVLVVAGKSQTSPETKPAILATSADDSTPAAPAVAAPTQRAVSPTTAARINEKLPKFSPPKPDDPKEAVVDQPRNGIVRLPKYIVREPKQPAIRDWELLTPAAKLDLALKEHPGLKIGNFWGLNNGIAMSLLEEERRLEQKSEMTELADLYRYSGKPGESAEVKRATDEIFMRHMGPSH